MIAIWKCQDSSPLSLCCLQVEAPTQTALLKAVKEQDYPIPDFDDEIIFIENDIVIEQECFCDLKE